MRKYLVALAALSLTGCDGARLKSTTQRTDTTVEVLASGDGMTAFAWRDPSNGCQYVTTKLFENAVSTIPRRGYPCPAAKERKPVAQPGG